MSWRMKVANWISGGEIERDSKALIQSIKDVSSLMETTKVLYDQRREYSNALWDIAAQEKPTSNSTVKRMARIANEALGRG